MENWKDFKAPGPGYEAIDLDDAYRQLYEVTGVRIDKNGDVLLQLNNLAVNVASYTKGKDSDNVACMAHMVFDHNHMIFPKSAFSKTEEVPFETGSVYIPGDYDTVLKTNYGPGYLNPDTGSPHDYPYYKQQERLVRDYVIANPDVAEFMPKYYIQDIYEEDPAKKAVLDRIYNAV